MSSAPRPTPSPRRTRLVTGLSIAAVAVAGAVAVGANIGILDAADQSNVGDLAAAGDLTSPRVETPSIELVADEVHSTAAESVSTIVVPTSTAQTAASTGATSAVDATGANATGPGFQESAVQEPAVQEFVVGDAGSVTIASDSTGIWLDGAVPSAGWTWSLEHTDRSSIAVTFVAGDRTLRFHAEWANGSIVAGVDEVVQEPTSGTPVPNTTATSQPAGGEHAEGDDEADDGTDHEADDEADHDEADGAGDHHEYEGGDDDD